MSRRLLGLKERLRIELRQKACIESCTISGGLFNFFRKFIPYLLTPPFVV